MATLGGLLRRVEAFDGNKAAEQSIELTKYDLLSENKKQMYDGKTRTGDNITPTYQLDPYFKTPQAAQRYSDWKDEITPNSNRPSGVPNLFIDGTYYGTLDIVISGDVIQFPSSFKGANDINTTFAGIHGLGGPYKALYLKDFLRPAFSTQVYIAIGIKPKSI